jgi:dTDP-4-amino-4,6-dideoxygalactose transaminase
MTGRIYLSPPDIGEVEQRYVVDALRSGWVAPVGPDLTAFEQDITAITGTAHVVALSSGTAALHLALAALGVGPGQHVVVPTLTFVATANAVRYTGAEPVFVDCDPQTGNVDPSVLESLLRRLFAQGRRVGAVMSVDLFGTCAEYDALRPICAEYNVPLVEDAAEALGASYQGRPAGSFGRAAAVSFNGNKIATTSGGGALCSDDVELIAYCRYLSTQAREPVVHYEHTEVGYNYRLSNILAALGRAQLSRLPEMIAARRAMRERYAKLFGAVDGVRLLAADDGANCWLTVIVVDPAVAGWRAQDLARALADADIETRPVWKPMHRQPVYAGFPAELTGAADRLFETALTLPSGSALTPPQIDRILDTITAFLETPR